MLKIYNTLTKTKQTFKPLNPESVSLYLCGITVYDYCHMGHARTVIGADVIARYLKFLGYELRFVRNITDIDDKIIQKALQEKKTTQEITNYYIQAMYEDYDTLSLIQPDFEPKATDYIPNMIEFIQTLMEKGFAYLGSENVYYSVEHFKAYGKFAHRALTEQQAGARVAVAKDKRNSLDFVLWKKAKPGEPGWPSPWGVGRPGWHIECSTMAIDCLGETLDLHCGGLDLKFPHHENEIAQSVAATGKPFVNTWIHFGFLQVNSEKMSKSLGNFFTIREVLKSYEGEVIRFFMINSHYRSPLDYCVENLEKAKRSLNTLYTALRGFKLNVNYSLENTVEEKKFLNAMDDDFNTPEALSILFEIAHQINRDKKTDKPIAEKKANLLVKLGSLLGLLSRSPEDFFKGNLAFSSQVENLIHKRNEARKNKQWEKSDKIRDQLYSMGIRLEDTKEGTLWRKES